MEFCALGHVLETAAESPWTAIETTSDFASNNNNVAPTQWDSTLASRETSVDLTLRDVTRVETTMSGGTCVLAPAPAELDNDGLPILACNDSDDEDSTQNDVHAPTEPKANSTNTTQLSTPGIWVLFVLLVLY